MPDQLIPYDSEPALPGAPSTPLITVQQGDLIFSRRHPTEFYYFDKSRTYEGQLIVDSFASIINYHETESGPQFYGKKSQYMEQSDLSFPTQEQMAMYEAALVSKDMIYDSGRRAFMHNQRRTIGATYHYITDTYVKATALDDGTTIHTQRFNCKNYFQEGKQELAQKMIDVIKWQTTEVRIVK